MLSKIPLARPYFDSEEIKEVKKVLDSGWVTQGPKVKEFETKIADYLGARYVTAVTNCTSALHLALLSMGIKKGDEVLVADYTFPATGHAVLYCGAKPVFVDIDLKTYNMNPDSAKEKLTNKTKAIIPVHTFGQPADMSPIMKLADKYGLKVIEDAACALGARYKNAYAGTIGDIGCFSLHGRKGITTGEGGIVVTNNRDLAKKARNLSVFGIRDAQKDKTFNIPQFTALGYNYKMSDIAAGVAVAQLKKLDKIIKRKQVLAEYWDEKLQDIEFITPPYVSKNVTHIYQSYVALVDAGIDRNKIIAELMKQGVQAQIGTYSSHIQPVYKSKDKCQNSLEIFKRALALPVYYALKEKDIDIIIEILRGVL